MNKKHLNSDRGEAISSVVEAVPWHKVVTPWEADSWCDLPSWWAGAGEDSQERKHSHADHQLVQVGVSKMFQDNYSLSQLEGPGIGPWAQ